MKTMMGGTPRRWWVAVAAISVVAASGCTSAPTTEAGDDVGGVLRLGESEPAFLYPSNGNDEPAIHVIRQLYRGLTAFNAETSEVDLDLAESISSADQTLWTVTLKPGYTFTNGEPVDADAFIRAWNYTAYGPNAQNNSYFMARVVGFDDMQADGENDPTATELAGLRKVEDLTFEVELSQPFSAFPALVQYSGMFPMAQACLDDIEACNEVPIGNGPYKIEGSWEHNVGITLVRNEDFAGEPGKADRLEYRIFADTEAEYAAFQANEIDIMHTIPSARYQQAKTTYGDHLFETPGNSFTYVGMPMYQPPFDNKLIRQALSLAIDRQPIIDAVFDGRFTVASGFVSPTFAGYRPGVCGYCEHDPERAREVLAEAGGWPGGPLQLWANAGADHEQWLQAVGDQIRDALGIDYELRVSLEFPQYLEVADENQFTGPYRLGWGPDYPVTETYLAPLYYSGASSNYSGYANAEFDELIRRGDGASSIEEAIELYQQAEDLLGEDLPVIPMWFTTETVLYSENVDGIVWNAINDVDYHKVTVRSAG